MPTYAFGEYELDTSLYQLRQSGTIIEIGPRVFDVLVYLILHRDHLVTKDELIREVWCASAMSGSSVPTCIAAVRKAIGDDPANPRYIETHRGRGYRFIAPITEIPDERSQIWRSSRPDHPFAKPNSNHPIFVGRDTELAALYAAFERSLTGTPQLVLVSGEAGIGKTRILEELALSVRDDGAVVLLGRCVEGGGAPAFWPWVQIIRTYIEATDAGALSDALGSLVPSLFHMIPELSDLLPNVPPPPPDDSEQARFRLFDAVTALLRKAAAERPLLLLIDDLHRADAASLSLLQFAIHELRETSILFVGTYRDGDPQLDDQRAHLLAHLTREEPTRCIELRGLDQPSVEKLVEDASESGTADPKLVSALHEQTGGNPFFLTQIVHLLVADGRLEMPYPGPRLFFKLPTGIKEAIGTQMRSLPSETSRVLELAATIGREFSIPLIGAVTNQMTKSTLDVLEPALECRLITPVSGKIDRYRFAHIMVRDCIYDGLTAAQRAHRHHLVAEGMESFYQEKTEPHSAELAYHYHGALLRTGPAPAIKYSLRAAAWAQARLAHEDVPAHIRLTFQLLDQDPSTTDLERGELLLDLSEAELRAGERIHSQRTLNHVASIARSTSSPDLLAQAALRLAPGFFSIEVGVVDPILISLLEEAIAAIGQTDLARRTVLLSRLSTALVWSDCHEYRKRLANESLSLARRISEPLPLANALISSHGTLWAPDALPHRRAILREVGLIPEIESDSELHLMHKLLAITAALESGDIKEVDREIEEFQRIALSLRRPDILWYSELFAAMRLLMLGNFASAETYSKRFLTSGIQAKDRNALHAYAAQNALLRLELGNISEILPPIQTLVDENPSIAGWRATLTYLLAEAGDLTAARHAFSDLQANQFTDFDQHESDGISLNLAAASAALLDDKENAEILYKILLPAARNHTVIAYAVAYFGPVSDRLGQLAATLGIWDDSFYYFEDALERCVAVRSEPWLARVQYDYAKALLAAKTKPARKRSSVLASQSHAIASRYGMRNLLRKIDGLFHD